MSDIPDEGREEDPCEQCGLCCRIFGNTITPTHTNLYSWIEQGRTDILRHFSAFLEDGNRVNCSDLRPEDLGSVIRVEMLEPDSGTYPTVCPFLRRVTKNRYLCGIHAVKPEMCRNYQPWIWGETYFGRCRALKTRENHYTWRHICE